MKYFWQARFFLIRSTVRYLVVTIGLTGCNIYIYNILPTTYWKMCERALFIVRSCLIRWTYLSLDGVFLTAIPFPVWCWMLTEGWALWVVFIKQAIVSKQTLLSAKIILACSYGNTVWGWTGCGLIASEKGSVWTPFSSNTIVGTIRKCHHPALAPRIVSRCRKLFCFGRPFVLRYRWNLPHSCKYLHLRQRMHNKRTAVWLW